MKTKNKFKAGFVSVAGLPNVGKSTLLNMLIGAKLAIVSPKPQTTRGTVRGILTTDQSQIIFTDTAGIHKPKDRLGDFMVDTAKKTFFDADVIYLIVESSMSAASRELELIDLVKKSGKTIFLVINKIDLVKRDALLPLIDHYRSLIDFDEIVPVSALEGNNTDKLLELTVSYLPEAPPFYPEDVVSEQIERDFISEFIREKLYFNTREEIPYSTAVVVEDMQERGTGGAHITACIYVERDSQKGIIIGKKGQMIKKIGSDARREIEQFLGYPVYLALRVKVEKNWREKTTSLKKLGYR